MDSLSYSRSYTPRAFVESLQLETSVQQVSVIASEQTREHALILLTDSLRMQDAQEFSHLFTEALESQLTLQVVVSSSS